MLYLGVFILLLAFFIVLNALSSFEERRAGAVMDSVAASFASPFAGPSRADDAAREAARAEAALAIRELGELFRAQIAIAKVEIGGTGDEMAVTLPAEQLFQGMANAVRPDRTGLLHRVADALVPRAAGIQVRLEMLLSAGDAGGPIPDPIARAGSLARRLTGMGAPGAAMTVGLEPVPAGQVRLIFSVHDPMAPAVRLMPGGGRP